jgi:hypothetical protein
MGVKYQLLSCRSPHQYLQVTLNHLDTISEMVKNEGVTDLVQLAISKAIDLYCPLSNGNWLLLEQVLMQFLQGKKIKVSLFLQRNLQSVMGTITLNNSGNLPFGTEIPGEIRYFEGGNYIRSDLFNSDLRESCTVSNEIIEPFWPVGFNIYTKDDDTSGGVDAGNNNNTSSSSSSHIIGSPTSVKGGTSLIERANLAARSSSSSSSSSSHQGQGPGLPGQFASIPAASRAFAKHAGAGGGALSSAANPKAPAMPPRSPSKYSTHMSAKAELTMLADLLGVTSAKRSDKRSDDRLFKINLFPNSSFQQSKEEAKGGSGGGGDSGTLVIDIDASSGAKSLNSYMADLDLDWDDNDEPEENFVADSKQHDHVSDDEDDDLLALMDSVK